MLKKTWKDFIYTLVIEHCNNSGIRTFTMDDFWDSNEEELVAFSPSNKHPRQKLSEQLQFLRNDGIISFGETRGNYTLQKPLLLRDELINTHVEKMVAETIEKKEYLMEIFARDRGWITMAKETYGVRCLHPQCHNTFDKEDGRPYIEVHHIIPLSNNGEDALWNLIVVCAHHHKMAHFADVNTQSMLQEQYLNIVQKYI